MSNLDFLIKFFDKYPYLVLTLLFVGFIIIQFDKIESIVNFFKRNKDLDDYLSNHKEETESTKALKEMKENQIFSTLGYPYTEKPKREALLKLHKRLNGAFSYKQVFAIESNVSITDGKIDLRFSFLNVLKLCLLFSFGIIFLLIGAYFLNECRLFPYRGIEEVLLVILALMFISPGLALIHFSSYEMCTYRISKYVKKNKIDVNGLLN